MNSPSRSFAPSWLAKIEHFFFASERPVGLALVRMAIALVLLIPTLHRVFRVRELYSQDGAPTPIWLSYSQPDFLPIPTSPVAMGLYAVLILSLITTCVGWRTRLSLAVAAGLTAYFGMLDMISTITKYTVVATHVLAILAMSNCGHLWSVDAWLARRRGTPLPEEAAVWPRRLIQILIGVVYLGSTMTKLHTPAFFTGDHLRYWMLTNVNVANPLGEFLTQYPGLIISMAYVTVVWEILFLFVAWRGVPRLIMLGLGVFFHVMTMLTLGLYVFPLIYFAIYLAWADQADLEWWRAKWGLTGVAQEPLVVVPSTRFRIPSLVAWAGAIGAVYLLGVGIDRMSDPFEERRAEGRHSLQPISEERVAELLRNDSTVHVTDKVFALDIGSVMFNDTLVDRRQTFTQGEKARIQCSLQPPHEDMFVEVHLLDETGQIHRRLWQVVSRENLRGHFWFQLDESLEPGAYQVVLRIDGKQAALRSLELTASSGVAQASYEEMEP